jgi:hypothetical protein
MSQKSKWDYLKAIYSRYQKVSKPLRARILDEFARSVATTANTPSGCSMVRRHKTQDKPKRPSPHLWPESHLVSYGYLGGGGLSVLGAPQSSPTVMAPLGPKALRYFGPSPKTATLDQPRHHRPATQAQKTPTQKQTLRTHQTRHSAQGWPPGGWRSSLSHRSYLCLPTMPSGAPLGRDPIDGETILAWELSRPLER